MFVITANTNLIFVSREQYFEQYKLSIKSNLLTIRSFVAVAKNAGFRRAAEELGVAAASVSQHVAMLEKELGYRLINRTTRSVQLTDVGRSYFEHCQRIFTELDEVTEGARCAFAEPTGLLRVSVSGAFGRFVVTPLIMRFAQMHPHVEIDIILTGQFVDLHADAIDIAIRVGTARAAAPMGIKRFAPVRRILCASHAYLEKHGMPRTPNELADHLCVVRSHRPVDRVWRLTDGAGIEHAVPVNGRVSANETELMLEACLSGLGVAFVPEVLALPYLNKGRLARVLEGYRPPDGDLHAVYRADHLVSPKVRSLLAFLENDLNAAIHAADEGSQ